MQQLEKEYSVKGSDQFFLTIYHNPYNKMDLHTLKNKLTFPELLDYIESLEMMYLLEDARNKDHERELNNQSKTPNRSPL